MGNVDPEDVNAQVHIFLLPEYVGLLMIEISEGFFR